MPSSRGYWGSTSSSDTIVLGSVPMVGHLLREAKPMVDPKVQVYTASPRLYKPQYSSSAAHTAYYPHTIGPLYQYGILYTSTLLIRPYNCISALLLVYPYIPAANPYSCTIITRSRTIYSFQAMHSLASWTRSTCNTYYMYQVLIVLVGASGGSARSNASNEYIRNIQSSSA